MQKRSLLYIGNKLSGRGMTASTIDTLSLLLKEEGFTVYSASSKINKALRFVHMLWSVIKYSKKVSVVLIDTYSTQNFYYAVAVAKLCRLLKVAYIPILHGGNLPERLHSNPKTSKTLFGKAKTNISPSIYLLNAFNEKGFNNVQYIPNSITVEKYPFFLRKEIKPRLLWVRSFAEIYNPMLAVELIKNLLKRGIDVSLTMVGPEKDGSLARCKAKSEANELPITFTGKLEKQQWTELSKEHDIFINTTNFDNMPVSVIEAMALGLIVVSTNVGGIPFIIEHGETGILVQPNSAPQFEEAIASLLTNSISIEKISQNGRTFAETLDWQKVKHSWMGLLSD